MSFDNGINGCETLALGMKGVESNSPETKTEVSEPSEMTSDKN